LNESAAYDEWEVCKRVLHFSGLWSANADLLDDDSSSDEGDVMDGREDKWEKARVIISYEGHGIDAKSDQNDVGSGVGSCSDRDYHAPCSCQSIPPNRNL